MTDAGDRIPARGYPYAEFEGEMILRDHLAHDRTRFALLRTFLSICRTALGLLASGAGLVILQTSWGLVALGWVLIVVAMAVLAAGGVYGWHAKSRLDGLPASGGWDPPCPPGIGQGHVPAPSRRADAMRT